MNKRIDTQGRDVTDLPGLHDESDRMEPSWVGRRCIVARRELTVFDRHRTGVICVVEEETAALSACNAVKIRVVRGGRLNGLTRWIDRGHCSILSDEE